MVNHRRQHHRSFKPCKNLPNCDYQETCLFNHDIIGEDTFICYECGEKFTTLSDLMCHRKQMHKMINCKKFLKNNCSFTNDKCWYTHKLNDSSNETENLVEMDEPKNDEQKNDEQKNDEQKNDNQKNDEQTNEAGQEVPVFWEAKSNLAPPSNPASFSQATWIKMMTMMTDLKEMMKEIKRSQ